MNFFRTIQMYIKENPIFHLFGRLFYNRIRPNIAQGIEEKEQQISQRMSQIMTSRLAVTASSSQALFHTTIQKLSTQARKPMIKFLGSRHPQPKYNPSALTTTAAPASSSPSKSSNKKAASSGVVIEFYELPQRLRSKPISDREIQIINSGGCLN